MNRFALLIFLPLLTLAAPEAYYQAQYAATIPGAKMEVVAPDGTRCDILTETHAIEVDFGPKWAESVGQSLNYALQFNKRAGILLILETKADYKYFIRLATIIKQFSLPIDLWPLEAYSQPLPPANGSTAPANATAAQNQATTQQAQPAEKAYWMTISSGKRHNSSCRYYHNSNGRTCTKDEGIPCKICGG